MKIIFSILLWFLSISFCYCQDYVDLAKFHYATTPQNNFDSIGGSTNIEEFGADILLPIKLNEENIILSGLYLEQIKTKLHPLSSTTIISTINLKLGFNKIHSEKWSGTYMFLPKLSSDFKTNSSKNLQLGALILMKYAKKENLKYSFGAYYNNELFGTFIVPLLGMYYSSTNNKFEINATLPIWADMNYKIAPFVNFGTNFSAFVRSYYLGNNNAYVVKKTNEIFGYLQFNFTKSILLQTKVGYSIGRSYRVYSENEKVDMGISAFRFGDNRTQINPDFNDGIVYKIRLIYRYNLNKNK